MSSFMGSDLWNRVFTVFDQVIGITGSENVKRQYRNWEEEEGNVSLSFLNKAIQIFLIAKKLFPQINWNEQKELVSIVLIYCKNIGEKILLKENGKLIEVEVVNRSINDDGSVEIQFSKNDGSKFSRAFYD